MLRTLLVKSVCSLATVAVLASGCTRTMAAAGPRPGDATATASTGASSLRSALNGLLSEHVILAAVATGAALDGRDADFKAASGALDANSVDIAKAIGSVYGTDAEQAFLPLWRRHIGFAVDYTVGVATKDGGKAQKAVADLLAYTEDFGAFLASANPHLPKSVVAGLVKHHVVTLKDVIDAQASKDYARAYAAQRAATAHMKTIADPLAAAIAKQFPDRFAGLYASVVELLRDPATRVIAMHGAGPTPGAIGRVVWHETQGGRVFMANLPAPPEGKTYELWTIAGGTPRPAGLFLPDAAGRASHAVPAAGKVDVFAVTLEPAGGVPAPTGPIVLASAK